jgi:hypothetical protein
MESIAEPYGKGIPSHRSAFGRESGKAGYASESASKSDPNKTFLLLLVISWTIVGTCPSRSRGFAAGSGDDHPELYPK